MDALLRATLVRLYGEDHVAALEAAPFPGDAPPAEPAPDTEILRDEAEAARFAAEIERDASLGSHADWPDL